MTASAFAPAKVNLYLHVGPLGPDGFHPLETLMVFADLGDEVFLASGSNPTFTVTGPFAVGLGEGDNLVTRAADLLRCSESLTTGTVSRPDPAAARQTAQHTTSTP